MKKVEVVITMNMQTGEINVTGPLDQKPLVCKMLSQAITAVIDHNPPAVLPLNRPASNGVGIIKN